MEIKSVPENFASLCEPLYYIVTDTASRDFELSVINYGTGEIVGAKRLLQTDIARVDIAPYLRRQLTFVVKTGPTGFVNAAARVVATAIRVDGVFSPERTFTPAPHTIVPPAKLTTMPAIRSIASDECDELTFCTPAPCVVQIRVNTSSGPQTTTYTAPNAGFAAFRLNAADFPNVKSITVNAGEAGMVTYYVGTGCGGRRIAWRSSEGSVEHYTFPVEKDLAEEVEKEQVFTASGYRPIAISARTAVSLLSAYEPREILDSLREITSSPAVWCIEEGVYIPVEVVSDKSGIRTHGALRNMEIRIRYSPKIQMP